MAADSAGVGDTLSRLEIDVLRLATVGSSPDSAALRSQLDAIISVQRSYTGFGFYLDIEIDRSRSLRAHDMPDAAIHGVTAEILGLEHGAGFIVSVNDGYLTQVEGFSYDEPWPTGALTHDVSLGEGGRLTLIPRQIPSV